MTLVVDASAVVAALVDSGPDGEWAEAQLRSAHLIAPHVLPAEVTNVLRRVTLNGSVSSDIAAMALRDLSDLPVDLYAYEPFADRVWQLRHSVNSYDSWYVALAETTGSPLVTLDRRLALAHGPQCDFVVP